jgi:hypothetical protein
MLFSGKVLRIVARGTRWNSRSNEWDADTRYTLRLGSFIKADSYHLTLFIMAARFLDGETYLSI